MIKELKKPLVASAVGLGLIAGFEGFSSISYEPLPGDKLTIGFGHTGDVKQGDTVTLREAFKLLEGDVVNTEAAINKHVKVWLTQRKMDALVSLVYNIGADAFRTSTLLKCINRGDEECVDTQWMRWKYFKGKPQKGLERRRAVELAYYRGKSIQRNNVKGLCVSSGDCISYSELALARPSGLVEAD